MGILTFLLAPGTWAVHVTDSTLGASGAASTSDFQLMALLDSGTGAGVDLAQNHIGPTLELVLLYFAATTTLNTDSTGFSLSLRRNGTTDVSSIDFDPDEVGRRSRILHIPILVTDFLQLRVHHRQGFSSTNYSLMVCGKLS